MAQWQIHFRMYVCLWCDLMPFGKCTKVSFSELPYKQNPAVAWQEQHTFLLLPLYCSNFCTGWSNPSAVLGCYTRACWPYTPLKSLVSAQLREPVTRILFHTDMLSEVKRCVFCPGRTGRAVCGAGEGTVSPTSTFLIDHGPGIPPVKQLRTKREQEE